MTTGDDIQVVIFRGGTQEFALEISQVDRILRYQTPSPVPSAPDFLEGVLAYGDGVVPVVDLRKRLGLPALQQEETRVMIVTMDGQRVGMIVDGVREVLRIDSRRIAPPPPMVRGLAAKFISGVLTLEDRTVILLQAGRLFSSEERLQLEAARA
ncbi:MAG TPA: chemotaxis protein CheW [Gemmatimonadales bacterium]|nr:chemotaxis protein CheW [Gemmatimonadales bacterium]